MVVWRSVRGTPLPPPMNPCNAGSAANAANAQMAALRRIWANVAEMYLNATAVCDTLFLISNLNKIK